MISRTTAETALLTQGRYAGAIRVTIHNGGTGGNSVYQRVDAWTTGSGETLDFVRGLTISADVDAPMMQMDLELWRERYGYSIAPGVTSELNRYPDRTANDLIRPNHEVYVDMAMVPEDGGSGNATWIRVFHGYLGSPEWSNVDPTIKVTAYDLGVRIQGSFPLPGVGVLGTTEDAKGEISLINGRAIDLAIQDLLTAYYGGPDAAPTVYMPSPVTFTCRGSMNRAPLLELCQQLADLPGAKFCYRHDGTSTWKPTLYLPTRTNTTADLTISGDFVQEVRRIGSTDPGRIRNRVYVTYTSSTNSTRSTVNVSDASSITEFWTRPIMIAEDAASQIDTNAEATTFATAVRDDLSKLRTEAELVVFPLPHVQLHDLLAVGSMGRHTDAQYDFAVQGYEHTWDPDQGARTTLKLLGYKSSSVAPGAGYAVVGSIYRWHSADARPGVNPPVSFRAPRACWGTAYNTANIWMSSTYAQIKLDTISVDTGGDFDVSVNKWYLTAPLAGLYHIRGQVKATSLNAYQSVYAALYATVSLGSSVIRAENRVVNQTAAAADTRVSVSMTIRLAAGDIVRLFGRSDSADLEPSTAGGAEGCTLDWARLA